MPRKRVDFGDLPVLVLCELSDPRADHVRANQRADPADHVDAVGTGKVMEAHLRKPAAAPGPVCLDRIDQGRDDPGVHAVRKKTCPLCHGAGDDRGRRGAEHQVEDEIGPVKRGICREDIKSRFSNEADQILSQEQTESDDNKHDCPDAEIHQIFHQNIAGVLRPREAGLHHGKPGLHPEDQRRTDQKPNPVYLSMDGI